VATTRYDRVDPDRLDRAPAAVEAGAVSARRLLDELVHSGARSV
jgi:hypothetical protein